MSTSTSYRDERRQLTVLPSIHDMFPEHLIPRGWEYNTAVADYVYPPPAPDRAYSFDNIRRHSRGASIRHMSSNHPYAQFTSSRPHSRPHSSRSSSNSDVDEDMGDGEELGLGIGKKHPCDICGKRFNRPSS